MIQKKPLIIFALIALNASVSCQTPNIYPLASEKKITKQDDWKKLPSQRIDVIGSQGNLLSVMSKDSLLQSHFFLYDESQNSLISEKVDIGSTNKVIDGIRLQDRFIFIGYFNLPDIYRSVAIADMPIEEFEYQDLWLTGRNGTLKLDKLPMHFIDKYYQMKFSFSGDYLICNAFSSRSAGYDSTQDGFFMIYDLTNNTNGRPKKQKVLCDGCMNTFYYGDKFVFQKEIPIGGGFDGFYHNIYESPNDNVDDTTRLAHDIELLSLTPDKKYALGAKYLFGKYTAVLLDVQSKRFQYLLGRDYLNYPFWYSAVEKKFGFDLGSHIVYVDFPKAFHFDALKAYKNFSKKDQNDAFWKKHEHPK